MFIVFGQNMGLEYLPLVMLLLGSSVILSMAALAIAFFNRRIARVLSILAGSAAVAVALIIMMKNRGGLSWLIYVMTEISLPTLVLWGAVLLSLVAARAPRSEQRRWPANAGANEKSLVSLLFSRNSDPCHH